MKNNHFDCTIAICSLKKIGLAIKKFCKNNSIFIILALAFILRLYRVNDPLLDWHSFRQTDTASVTREFVKHNYPIWLPHYQDLGNIQSGVDNLEGYRMVEFPIVNYTLAGIIKIFPSFDLVTLSRVSAALFSTLSIALLYLLIKKLSNNQKLALLSSTFFALIPFGIYFGRTVLPEPFQVFFMLATLLSFTFYTQKPKLNWFIATFLSFTLALLIKPTSIFIAPILVLFAWQKWQWRAFLRLDLWLLAIISVLPLLFWRQYILQFPSGVPASDWLLNGNGIRLRPAWWRWLFWERLTKDYLGYIGIIFFLPGILPEKFIRWKLAFQLTTLDFLTWVWLGSFFLYLVIFATGNVQHDYYQVILLPLIALLLARGLIWWQKLIIRSVNHKFKKIAPKVLIALLLSAFLLALQRNWGKFNINRWDYYHAGVITDRLLPSDAKVIASGNGDTSFLFQTNRIGWPLGVDIEDKIALGAQYFITTDFDDTYHAFVSQATTIYKDENFAILQFLPEATSSISKKDN